MQLFAVLAAGLLVATATYSAPETPDPPDELPLRLPDAATRRAVLDAMARSATFEGLVAGLRQRRALVYVTWHPGLPRLVRGAVMMRVAVAHDVRYLWITLTPDQVSDSLVAVIAHEVVHVFEILDAGLVDPGEIALMYRRLSGATPGTHIYDTPAAVKAGEQVRHELKASRPPRAP